MASQFGFVSNDDFIEKMDELIDALPHSGATGEVTGVKGNAESAYRVGNVNLTPANIGAVSKTGDTMSGALTHNGTVVTFKATNLDANGDNPTSDTWSNAGINYQDKDGDRLAFINVRRNTDGSTRLELDAQARNAADTENIYNGIAIDIGRDGTRSYVVSDPTAFRKAIGTGNQVTLTGAVTGTGTFDSNGNVASVSTTLNPELSGQINYNTNNGVKNLIDPEWFKTYPISIQSGAVESYNVKTGSITGYAPASDTRTYISINIDSDWCNQFLENGKTYILSWTVDSRTNDGIFGFRRADNNTYSVGGVAAINRTGNYSVTYTHNASIPVYFSFCINTTGTSSEKRIAISNLMLREATIEDDTFEPYAKSNAVLTQEVANKADTSSASADGITLQNSYANAISKVELKPGSTSLTYGSSGGTGKVAVTSNQIETAVITSGGTGKVNITNSQIEFTIANPGGSTTWTFDSDGIYKNGTKVL